MNLLSLLANYHPLCQSVRLLYYQSLYCNLLVRLEQGIVVLDCYAVSSWGDAVSPDAGSESCELDSVFAWERNWNIAAEDFCGREFVYYS